MAVDPRTPCVIGVAQRTWHLSGEDWAPEPLQMQAEVVAAAIDDSAATGDLHAAVDGIDVVHCMSWAYDDPPRRLAEAVGTNPARLGYSGMGGTVPQQLLGAAAGRILAGQSDVELVVGAEALDTKRRMKSAGERPQWSYRHPEPPGFPFEAPFHPAEVNHEVFQAWLTFAMRDIARRARIGTEPLEHRRLLGELMAPLTDVAAMNPHAWFPQRRSAEELVTATAQNRMVGYPYTKTMVAVMDVDMAAASVLASWEAADRLGVPTDRRVPLRGWSYATDPNYVAEHPDLSRSPAMASAGAEALRLADVDVSEISYVDLYSCFASSIAFACDALGIDASDPRSLTVTGGLPYAGGPASNYMGHALCSMVQRIRSEPGSLGLITGVGMHMTKHIAAVYGGNPEHHRFVPPDLASLQASLERNSPRRIEATAAGSAHVAAYSVIHARDASMESGVAVCDLPGGARTYARCEDADMLASWEAEEWVGRPVELSTDGTVNRITG